jgi:hypothetical protein
MNMAPKAAAAVLAGDEDVADVVEEDAEAAAVMRSEGEEVMRRVL